MIEKQKNPEQELLRVPAPQTEIACFVRYLKNQQHFVTGSRVINQKTIFHALII